jgi:hypothetical protein
MDMRDTVYLDLSKRGDDRFVSTPWLPTGQPEAILALAAAARKERASQDTPPEGEVGTGWDRWRLFSYYEDGKIFAPGPIETRDIDVMLERDGQAREIEQALTLPLRSLKWDLKGGKGDHGELAFCEEALLQPPESGTSVLQTPWDLVLDQMTNARIYRRCHFELVWVVGDDNQVRLEKVAYRPPNTCYTARLAKDASLAGFMQWGWEDMEYKKWIIPAEKAFVHIHGEYRNPLEGVSDVAVVYQAYTTKQKLRYLWYSWLETQAGGRWKAKVSVSDEGQAEELAKRTSKLQSQGVIGLTENEDVEPLQMSTTQAPADYAGAVGYLDSEMAHSVLKGFLDLISRASASTESPRGSYALGANQREYSEQADAASAKEIANSATRSILAPLCRYNFGPEAVVPTVTWEVQESKDPTEHVLTLFQALATAPAGRGTDMTPKEFSDQLVELTAGILGMDTDPVAKALAAAPTPPPTPGQTPEEAAIHGKVAAAAGMVGAAGAGATPPLPPAPPVPATNGKAP